MIISVHIPRTAGSSFRAYLRGHSDISLMEDYGSPIMVPSLIRNTYAKLGQVKNNFTSIPDQYNCLHGHFLPIKYRQYLKKPDVHFITWLREPALRIRSQYDYCFQSDKAVDRSPFQNKVARENWSFEKFYSDARMQNLYSKFLWKFPISNFDFIGIVEKYDEDFKYFCETYLSDYNPKYMHGNRTLSAQVNAAERAAIEKLNSDDYFIYREALQLRKVRVE